MVWLVMLGGELKLLGVIHNLTNWKIENHDYFIVTNSFIWLENVTVCVFCIETPVCVLSVSKYNALPFYVLKMVHIVVFCCCCICMSFYSHMNKPSKTERRLDILLLYYSQSLIRHFYFSHTSGEFFHNNPILNNGDPLHSWTICDL